MAALNPVPVGDALHVVCASAVWSSLLRGPTCHILAAPVLWPAPTPQHVHVMLPMSSTCRLTSVSRERRLTVPHLMHGRLVHCSALAAMLAPCVRRVGGLAARQSGLHRLDGLHLQLGLMPGVSGLVATALQGMV